MDNNEEFFYSENPQEIEKEKKKRSALHSLFPNLMGGKTDKTKYVPDISHSTEHSIPLPGVVGSCW